MLQQGNLLLQRRVIVRQGMQCLMDQIRAQPGQLRGKLLAALRIRSPGCLANLFMTSR